MKTVERAPAKFNLPVELSARLAEAVPSGQRSRFVARAIEDALRQSAKDRLLGMLEALPAHDTGGENSVEVLRGLRQGRTAQLADRHNPLSQ